ncbi:MAG: hypothetical protein N4A47_03305 [Clostridia bacterium]|jgi:hypothetical protein|nr:hypothetical protein [Clostridia bacterium]
MNSEKLYKMICEKKGEYAHLVDLKEELETDEKEDRVLPIAALMFGASYVLSGSGAAVIGGIATSTLGVAKETFNYIKEQRLEKRFNRFDKEEKDLVERYVEKQLDNNNVTGPCSIVGFDGETLAEITTGIVRDDDATFYGKTFLTNELANNSFEITV